MTASPSTSTTSLRGAAQHAAGGPVSVDSLAGQTILVLGLGDSGLAMAQWCARCGAAVRVADTRAQPPQAAALAESLPAATLAIGFDPALLDGVQRVLKSPGLSPLDPAPAPLLARAA